MADADNLTGQGGQRIRLIYSEACNAHTLLDKVGREWLMLDKIGKENEHLCYISRTRICVLFVIPAHASFY